MTEIQRAMGLIRQGNKTEAQPILEGLIRSDPRDVMSWFWYAETLDSTPKRLKLLEVCLKHNPGNHQVMRALEMLRLKRTPVQLPASAPSRPESIPSSRVEDEEPTGTTNVPVEAEPSTAAPVSESVDREEADRPQENIIPDIRIRANEKVISYLADFNPSNEMILPFAYDKVDQDRTLSEFIGHFSSMSGLPESSKYVIYGCEALVHPRTGIILGFVAGTSAIHRFPQNIIDEVTQRKIYDFHVAKDNGANKMEELEGNWVSSWSVTERLVYKCFEYYGKGPREQAVIHVNFDEDLMKPPPPASVAEERLRRWLLLAALVAACALMAFLWYIFNYYVSLL